MQREEEAKRSSANGQATWGAKLFVGTLLALAVFFWWLLIYSGGVAGHQGG